MKKRKLMAMLCAASVITAALSGCGTADTEKESTSQSESTSKETTEETKAEEAVSEAEAEKAGFSDGTEETEEASEKERGEASVLLDTESPLSGMHHAEIEIKDYGTIELELDADTAPISVTNFVKLAQDGFYDGLTFHRIMDGFMMQGGDPLGNGTGGSEETIKGEFSNNGVENDISHVRGVISMARSSDPDSASSQFFIVQSDSTFLDGDYAAFGTVTEGMEIVDKICSEAKPTDNNGSINKAEQPVIETIKIID